MTNDLKLDNQICFPLYACAKGIVGKYKPFLDELDLTYTQYITMMVMWEKKKVNVKTLGESLYLDSGTLTPLLKKLQQKGLISRERSTEDERNVDITLTARGEKLRTQAEHIPSRIRDCVDIPAKDAMELYRILHDIMRQL